MTRAALSFLLGVAVLAVGALTHALGPYCGCSALAVCVASCVYQLVPR